MIKKIKNIYEKEYKKLLLIPIIIIILAMSQIGLQYYQTGDFLTKGVSLKGGVTINIIDPSIEKTNIETALKQNFPDADTEVRLLSKAGEKTGIVVKIDLDVNQKDDIIKLKQVLLEAAPTLTIDDIEDNIHTISPSLGDSFFRATFKALIIAFIFMALVVFYYFRSIVPSLAVILAAFSDIVVTLAITNIIGMKISTAGIAAFLMLIGYSVDTDILLSTKVLKTKQGTVLDRVYRAMRTGLMMSFTTLAAIMVALYFTLSIEIKQIMTILLIGLLVDLVMTWFQNAGILRLYMEKKQKKQTTLVQYEQI